MIFDDRMREEQETPPLTWSNGTLARIHQESEVDQTQDLKTSRLPAAPTSCVASSNSSEPLV
jgi:hypothetical protein